MPLKHQWVSMNVFLPGTEVNDSALLSFFKRSETNFHTSYNITHLVTMEPFLTLVNHDDASSLPGNSASSMAFGRLELQRLWGRKKRKKKVFIGFLCIVLIGAWSTGKRENWRNHLTNIWLQFFHHALLQVILAMSASKPEQVWVGWNAVGKTHCRLLLSPVMQNFSNCGSQQPPRRAWGVTAWQSSGARVKVGISFGNLRMPPDCVSSQVTRRVESPLTWLIALRHLSKLPPRLKVVSSSAQFAESHAVLQ